MMTSSHLKETKENKWKQEEKARDLRKVPWDSWKRGVCTNPKGKTLLPLKLWAPFSSLFMSLSFWKKHGPLYSTRTLLINLGPSKLQNSFISSHVALPNVGPLKWLRTWGLLLKSSRLIPSRWWTNGGCAIFSRSKPAYESSNHNASWSMFLRLDLW